MRAAMGDIMDRSRTWQIALALPLPLIVGAAFYFSTNQTIQISLGAMSEAIPVWLALGLGSFFIGLLVGGEADRRSEIYRLNNRLEMAALVAASGPNRDARARALTSGLPADVGLIERRLELDLGLDGRASVAFHDRQSGKLRDINGRRQIAFIHVAKPDGKPTVGNVCRAIRDGYGDKLDGFVPRIRDYDGNDLHGNNRIDRLQSRNLGEFGPQAQ